MEDEKLLLLLHFWRTITHILINVAVPQETEWQNLKQNNRWFKPFMIFIVFFLVICGNCKFILVHLKDRHNGVKTRHDTTGNERYEDMKQGLDYVYNPIESVDQDYKGYDDYFGNIIVNIISTSTL